MEMFELAVLGAVHAKRLTIMQCDVQMAVGVSFFVYVDWGCVMCFYSGLLKRS